MKRMLSLLTALLMAALLLCPAAVAVSQEAAPPQAETVADSSAAGELPETITIDEEEVPLSAVPFAGLEGQSNGMNSRIYMLAGVAVMAVAVVGYVHLRAGQKNSSMLRS